MKVVTICWKARTKRKVGQQISFRQPDAAYILRVGTSKFSIFQRVSRDPTWCLNDIAQKNLIPCPFGMRPLAFNAPTLLPIAD